MLHIDELRIFYYSQRTSRWLLFILLIETMMPIFPLQFWQSMLEKLKRELQGKHKFFCLEEKPKHQNVL